MFEQLPSLVVAVPLIAAGVCAILRYDFMCWFISVFTSLISLFGSIFLYSTVKTSGVISYELGGWAPPVGIEYRVDIFACYLLILVSLVAFTILIYGRRLINNEIVSHLRGWFYSMYLLCMCGLMGIVITGDAFNAFVFMEISSLSMYTLIALGRDKRALLASYQYLILGTLGATMYVIGVGLLFNVTGTLNLIDISNKIQPILDTPSIKVAMSFIFAGLSIKIALFPLHFWLPNAYAFAPSIVTTFLAATATKVSVYLLMRYFYTVFGFSFGVSSELIIGIILLCSILAIFVGSFSAIFENNLKRLLAFSSVAQIGYITLGIAIANNAGLTGSMVHIFNHALMKASLFMILGAIAFQIQKDQLRLTDLSGLGKKMPFSMAAMTIAGLSLLGVPGTVGFVTKWYLIQGAMQNGWWWLVVLILVSSLLVLIYLGKVIETVYFKPANNAGLEMNELPSSTFFIIMLAVSSCIYLGFDTSLTLSLAEEAVNALVPKG